MADRAQILFWDIHLWSRRTFGTQRLGGVLAHLSKEVKELRDDPCDLEEYADVLMLVFDAASHAGYTYLELIKATRQKLEENERRHWVKQPDGSFQHTEASDGSH